MAVTNYDALTYVKDNNRNILTNLSSLFFFLMYMNKQRAFACP